MGLFGRIYNLWKGFIGIFVGRMEEKHPEIAYENAINGMTEKYSKLKSAAAGLIKHRAKLEANLQRDEAALEDTNLQIEMAVDQGDDMVAMALLERQDELQARLAEYKSDLQQAERDAETAKNSLRSVKEEIDKLKREKSKVVAQIKDAEARKQIQEQLDGISVDDDVQALSNVRDYADRVRAEVQIGDELEDNSIERRLRDLQANSGSVKARSRLEALKAARAKAQTGTTETEGEKTL